VQAMRNYTERYEHDGVGNFQLMRHIANGDGWTRGYEYTEASLLEPSKQSNRLTRTTVGNGLNHVEAYTYTDAQGNDIDGCMTAVNSRQMGWNFKDQLQKVDLGGGGTAYYLYDATGQRVRKVIETQNGARQKERIYLGGFEIYREYNGSSTIVALERATLHIMDDKQRIALVETKAIDNQSPIPSPQTLIRYQFSNHLGSASLELDDQAQIISYEEYYPYGSTSCQVGRSAAEMSLKRYRYTGKERDEESGFYYHGVRYYSPWLGRWIAADPIGLADGTNPYSYVSNNPLIRVDPLGMAGLVIEAGSSRFNTVPEAQLMEAGAEMAVRIQSDLREFFGLETDVNPLYKSGSGCGCGPGPGASTGEISKITVVVSQDPKKQEQSKKDLRARVEAAVTRDMAGKSPEEIHKEVESRMGKLNSARQFLEARLSEESTTVKLQTMEDPNDILLAPYTPMLGLRFDPGTFGRGDMRANPYTWGVKKDGSWVRAPEYSSERSRAALSPGLQLLHEFEHEFKSFIGGSFNVRDLAGFDEEGEVTRDVDKYVTAYPGVAERYWYGNIPGIHQSIPGSRYVLGKYGYGVKQEAPNPTDAEWVRWPTEDELKTGVRK